MSTLQRIAATIVLDLGGRLLLRDGDTDIVDLLVDAVAFRASHGPSLDLADVVRRESPPHGPRVRVRRRVRDKLPHGGKVVRREPRAALPSVPSTASRLSLRGLVQGGVRDPYGEERVHQTATT